MHSGDIMTEGWQEVQLGDVCKTGAGGTPLKSKKEYYEAGDIPWLVSGEVSQGEIFSSNNFITKAGLQNSSAKIFPKNTVLVAMYGATAGQVGILRFEAATNQAVCGIYPNENLLPEFIYYAFLEKKSELISRAAGNAQPNISQIKVKNTKISLPPLPEQKRIVAILDEAFEEIDRAVANAEKNLVNSRNLFESYLGKVIIQKSEGWEEVKLGDVCKTGAGGTPLKSKKEYYEAGDIPWLVSGEVSQGEIFSSNNFITKEGLQNSSAKIFPKNTVLVAMYGATAGQVGILRFEAATNQAVCGILPNKNLLPEFIYYAFLQKQTELISRATGNAQPNISQIKVKSTEIPLPPLHEQKRIVAILDDLSEKTKYLEAIYKRKLTALAELKQSILQRAFSGELTTNDTTINEEAIA
jgi:type I restriction enzyme, S subunit